MSDLAETISVERDGLRDMLERLAVSPETDAKVKGTVPPVGLGVSGGTVQVPPRGHKVARPQSLFLIGCD
jgi:hypothetical protein